MKKLTGLKVSIVALLLAIMLVVPIKGYAGWDLYDDFESPIINPLWFIENSSDDNFIFIEDGKLKIILNEVGGRCRLYFYHVEEIKAIRAKVRIVSCTEGGRVKIKGDWHYGVSYESQQAVNIFGAEEEDKIVGVGSVGYKGVDLSLSKLRSENKIGIMGRDFVVTLWFLSNVPEFQVKRLGRIIYEEELDPYPGPDDRWYSIEVRGTNGVGTCTAYFDNIEIFIDK